MTDLTNQNMGVRYSLAGRACWRGGYVDAGRPTRLDSMEDSLYNNLRQPC